MAIVDKPDFEQEDTVVLEDSDDASEDFQYSGFISIIRDKFSRSKDRRQSEEERWLNAYKNYRGIYDDTTKFTDTERSQIFIKITKTKVLAAYSQIIDVLFAGNKFPIGVQETKIPEGIKDTVHIDAGIPDPLKDLYAELNVGYAGDGRDVPEGAVTASDLGPLKDVLDPVKENVKSGPGHTPSAAVYEPAKEAARFMEKKIHDQLEESDASKHLRFSAFEMALFGTGIIKGPFAHDVEYPNWDETGEYTPTMRTMPRIEAVSIWNFYPDSDAYNMADSEYAIYRHRMSRSDLRELKNRPFFRDQSIERAITEGPNYNNEYWEDVIDDNNYRETIYRWEVLEYWGVIDRDIAEEAGLELTKELKKYDQIQINAWVCGSNILRLVLNPFKPTRIPFYAVPYELNPYSFFGVGVGENMEDTQMLMNGFMRMAVDNAMLSGNLIFEVDEANLVPGQDLSVYPGKVFRRQGGAPGQAIFSTKFQNVASENMMLFDKARQLADESTGIPSFSHGQTGISGVGRTASGISMLMGAAAQNIKTVVKNVDDYLLSPLGKSMFAFNMQFDYDERSKGDLSVIARGTESLMRNEIRSQRLMQMMQLGSNPMLAPMIKFDYIIREIAASLDLDEDKIVNDPREAAIQAMLMKKVQEEMQANQPPTPEGQQAQPPQGQEGVPNPANPSGTGAGNIGPGSAPEPGAPGFSANTGEGQEPTVQ
tara:strand:- start:3875 stop:6001 length:2127 start_codon:yes stop_codon:yes gene_type:complete